MTNLPDPAPQPETVDLPPSAPQQETSANAPPVRIGQAFGDYELLSEIARGGMGVVYQARERHSGQLVALKMMLDESASSPEDLSRFVLEAKAAGELHHPGIVAIHAWGVHEGHPFYTMDFVLGQPLHRLLERGPLPIEQAVRYLGGLASALAAAHRLGIVHRDLKPGNVIIDPADQPRVLDFGLAKRRRAGLVPPPGEVLDALPARREPLDALPAGSPTPATVITPRVTPPVTEKGAILGTPSYMAPEQVRAEHERVGPPADVHALGAIAYEMLTGRPPFQGDSTYATLMQVLDSKPAPLRGLRPQVPAVLEAVVHRCLAKDPYARYPDAGALAADLERRWQQHTQARRFARLAVMAALALLLLQGLQPLVVRGPLLAQGVAGLVRSLAPTVGPLHDAAGILDRLIYALLVVGGPLLGGLGLVAWAAAWAWHTSRPARLALLWSSAAAVVFNLWWLTGLADWPTAVIFLPWVLGVNALGVCLASVLRRSLGTPRSEDIALRSDSYLDKLFTVRGTVRPKKAVVASSPAEVADFELGKMLLGWESGAVHWARQKSLDRAVLVWRDCSPRDSGTSPGVVVRHPSVLGLHAVLTCPEDRLLVTEPVAASPLPEVLHQRPLTPREAVTLTARLAEAIQAFHDQGACHGRLRPEWVLVRGDLEPLLCPCGVPSRSAEDRVEDIRALGRMLQEWLPPRPWQWRFEMLAPLYRAADAAVAGRYDRAADFAVDLERAARASGFRWRERCATVVSFGLLLAPWLLLGLLRIFRFGEPVDGTEFLGGALLALGAAAVLFGYTQVRLLVQRRRLRGVRQELIFPAEAGRRLGLTAAFVLLSGALAWYAVAWQGSPAALPLVLGVLLGYWLCGALAAAAVTFGELLVRSLRRTVPPA